MGDINTAFDLEVQTHCPSPEMSRDLFHVASKYEREVITRVRVEERTGCGRTAGQKVIKSSRWLLLCNREHLRSSQQEVWFHEIQAANQSLMTVGVIK